MLPPISFHFEVDFWASQSSRTKAHMNRSEWPKTSRHDRPVRSRIIWHVVLWKTLSDLFKKPKVSDWDWRLHWNLLWHWTYFYLGGSCFFENTGETPHGQDYCLGLRDKPIPGDSSPYCWDHIRSPVPNARHHSLELLSDPGLIIVYACQSLLTY